MSDYFDRVERQLVRAAHAGVPRQRRVPHVPFARLGLIAGVAVVVLVAAGLLGIRGERQTTTSTGRIDGRLVSHFAVLRRAVKPSDRLSIPGDAVKQRFSMSGLGIVPKLARRVAVPDSTAPAWVVPGQRGLCLIALLPYAGARRVERGDCVTTARALSTPLFVTGAGASAHFLVGLLGDRLRQVWLYSIGAHRTVLPFIGGVFAGPYKPGDCFELRATGFYTIDTPGGSCIRDALPSYTNNLVTAIDPRVLAAYDLFRRPRRPSDRPPGATGRFPQEQTGDSGANPRLLRWAGPFGLVPARGCVLVFLFVNGGSGGGCEPTGEFIEGDVREYLAHDQPPGTVSIAGVVPDDVKTVEIAVRGSRSIRVPIHNNAFQLTVHGTPTAATLLGPSVDRHKQLSPGLVLGARPPLRRIPHHPRRRG